MCSRTVKTRIGCVVEQQEDDFDTQFMILFSPMNMRHNNCSVIRPISLK